MNASADLGLQFCTGFGQSDTRKNSSDDYAGISGREIVMLVRNPPSRPKAEAQWFIPSAYRTSDARNHAAQREQGAFWFLALDVDYNDLPLAEIDAALVDVCGDVGRLVYSSRSATAVNRKWRGLVPLASPVAGADYSDTASAFFDLLEEASQGTLMPDRALGRPGQLVYLPNRGEHYENAVVKAAKLELTSEHPITHRREETRRKRAEAEQKAKAWKDWKARQASSDSGSVVEAFNSSTNVAAALERYGYRRAGASNDYRSPFQTSGSFATRDYGDHWISLSASDAAQEIGQDSKTGHRFGDAFDLFVHFEHGGDFTRAVRVYAEEAGLRGAKRQDEGSQSRARGANGDADEDPVDLWGQFIPPELPAGLLPPLIEEFARVRGAQMGADPAGLAMAALTTCAAAIRDSWIRVQVKVHDPSFVENARLWTALVGDPSTKKSPIISAATGPLCRIDLDLFRSWCESVDRWHKMEKEERPPKPPAQTRLRIEDATVEAAQQVLEGSPWGMLLLQDELSGFFGAMDKYNGGKGASADRAFWLRAWNGGQFALNRVSRGAALIPNLSVSLLGGIQPEPIRRVSADAQDDGLLQRLFPIVLRPATLGQDVPVPNVQDRYDELIQRLWRLEGPGYAGSGVLAFSPGAQAVRRRLEERHLALQASEAVSRKLGSHLGKYDGLFARLALTFHCIEHPEGIPGVISEDTARRAGDFLHRFLLPHAAAFYGGILGLSDDHDRLTAVAGFILARGLTTITNRDVQRGDGVMRKLTEQDIRPLFEQLAAMGWLKMVPGPRPSSAPHWVVNPVVHRRFAERGKAEAERRHSARASINEMMGKT